MTLLYEYDTIFLGLGIIARKIRATKFIERTRGPLPC